VLAGLVAACSSWPLPQGPRGVDSRRHSDPGVIGAEISGRLRPRFRSPVGATQGKSEMQQVASRGPNPRAPTLHPLPWHCASFCFVPTCSDPKCAVVALGGLVPQGGSMEALTSRISTASTTASTSSRRRSSSPR
jgi:hypothetical protein